MNVFAVGASKNIGYYSAIRLLNKGATVTFLLRNTAVFDTDETVQSYVRSGKARLIKGDALNIEDVARGWAEAQAATEKRHVDFVLFTVGAAPSSFSLISGAHISPADLCSVAILNVVRTIPTNQRSPASQPKIIGCSSTGISKASHKGLPLPVRIFYGWLLGPPHVDKFCMERVLAHCAGMPFEDEDFREDLLPQGWRDSEGMPERGTLKKIVILRPAFLTDGPAKADEQGREGRPYRIHKGDKGKVGWSMSRRDVSHFIVENALERWDEYEGERVSLFY